MRFLVAAAIAAAAAAPAFAQDANAEHAGHAANATAASAARLNLDTPVEAILADPAGNAVLDAALPGLAAHEQYNAFKQMGLKQLANYAPDKLTPEVLTKIETALAAIK